MQIGRSSLHNSLAVWSCIGVNSSGIWFPQPSIWIIIYYCPQSTYSWAHGTLGTYLWAWSILVFIKLDDDGSTNIKPLTWSDLSAPGSTVFLLRCFSAMVHKLDSGKNILWETSAELCIPEHIFLWDLSFLGCAISKFFFPFSNIPISLLPLEMCLIIIKCGFSGRTTGHRSSLCNSLAEWSCVGVNFSDPWFP